MKNIKKLTSLILALTIVLTLSLSFATAKEETPVLDITTYNDWVQLLNTSNSFDISSNGVATMIATTRGVSNSTRVTLEMYLEKLQNGKWVEVMSWSTSSTSNYYVSLDKTRSVASGYYYRLRSEHSAKGPNGTDYDTVYSGTVLYNS